MESTLISIIALLSTFSTEENEVKKKTKSAHKNIRIILFVSHKMQPQMTRSNNYPAFTFLILYLVLSNLRKMERTEKRKKERVFMITKIIFLPAKVFRVTQTEKFPYCCRREYHKNSVLFKAKKKRIRKEKSCIRIHLM